MIEISTLVQFGVFLPCNLNMSLNPPWITSDCVEIVQNSVEVKRIKLKCKHEKTHNMFQNTQYRTAFEDLKVNRLTIKFKIKV